ncbi:PEP/pyruvate-binding domain-containing protein [Thermodesulfobacteriota bacterium]
MKLLDKILNIISFKKGEKSPSNVNELRTAFRERYHRFKLLLKANSTALEIMAEMEEALRGYQPFGMTFVRSRATSASINVWQIVENINDLSPGKYGELYEKFKEIQIAINPFIERKKQLKSGPLVISLGDIHKGMADIVGGKIANLGEIKNRIRLEVPNGFVVTSRGYQRFIEHNDLQNEIDRMIQSADISNLDHLYTLSSGIQQLIIRSSLPEDLESSIQENYRMLEESDGGGVKIAMRSSALGEDFMETSFAGQYRTMLNVSRENIYQAYKEIVASKYGLPAMSYRFNRGIRDEGIDMCVGCMVMVDAVSSGVMYSSNPVDSLNDGIVINSVWGLPKSVVDGSADSDLFLVSKEDPTKILKREIPIKDHKFVCYPDEGICRLEVSEETGEKASISDEQALQLAKLGQRLEKYYGSPQDIEWAIKEDDSFTILQCRPLGHLKRDGFDGLERITDGTDSFLIKGGVRASPGVGAGKVFIVKKDMEALQFPVGAVLVTEQSLPRWAPLLARASAVITERGGIAGHLANVAREFGVPGLFGIKGALDVIEQNQTVTVDADALKVYKGRVKKLLSKQGKRKNLMLGSPVFECLKGASSYITPLNLLDPDSPSFTPKNCKTFHDITRFCHEKSVHEMFQFGKAHHFPERSSKQLVCEVPMKWWVLNLDDGFNEEVEGKRIQIDNIVSIPMLALWEGITAYPWEGPPPVDGRGMMSVMFEATRNPALVPGLKSGYADRNYFIISKNYCSLNSRLGFHFSTVEAMVSERATENYISFQFKGGAADSERRERRILFISDILEGYDFRVQVKEDNLIARLEGRGLDFMVRHLKILGYLTIHTRQLDMIMSNNERVYYYRRKIHDDIKKMMT